MIHETARNRTHDENARGGGGGGGGGGEGEERRERERASERAGGRAGGRKRAVIVPSCYYNKFQRVIAISFIYRHYCLRTQP